MKRFWRPILLRFLKRDPGEIERRAAAFQIQTDQGRTLVASLGSAFIGGFNAMLERPSLVEVGRDGRRIEAHFRPFFYEGAAMGYLPRGYLSAGFTKPNAEKDLLGMDPGYRYLYYVGLGFWYGMRHPRRPEALGGLAPHVDPFYLPLCYDGFGFKTAFFSDPRRPSAWSLLERSPAEHRAAFHQGFGRALFFVFMDDEPGFVRLRDRLDPARRADFEIGRSLALAFTGVNRPAEIARHLASSRSDEERAARLLGVTWALAAREMNDAAYFTACLDTAPARTREILRRLPEICREALAASTSYPMWQEKTCAAAVRIYASFAEAVATEASRA